MAQTARVTLTLSNIATTDQIEQLEDNMSALSDAVAALRTAVENLSVAQSPQKVADLEAAVQAERDKYAALVASEDAEDVAQNQELADARAATDALIAEMNAAAGDLGGITAQLAAVGTAVDTTPDDTPVGEVPVEPAPDAPSPDDGGVIGGADGPLPPVTAPDAPAEGAATPGEGSTPDPSSPGTTDAAPTDGGTPAPADAAPAPAPATGPVDASGNAVDGPRL